MRVEREGGVRLISHCHGVAGDGGEVAEERAEAVNWQSVVIFLVISLRSAALVRLALATMDVRAALASRQEHKIASAC